ncbi:SGNH/GDSL hydrolase family protein [Streptococcus uberis]|uniref:SGNH/GDSL hydrolase family protein n=1 Tax=Streptococcus uberis TaxID=1349 RepID=UPI001FF52FC0|nr:SGNH/GDSL hydrolase family protein [Streptococcus uberis]MCK1227498.1 SGNH/GDSL hydrolase family protein [Streptococcus uberis]
MLYFNTLNLKQISGGNQVKQGDFGSTFSYRLEDEKNQEIYILDQKTAYINLSIDSTINFTTTAIVDKETVTFHIDKAIPTGLYYLEIKIDNYIFPSDKSTVILVEKGAVAYDLKDLIPNYDTNMTITGILSDLSQKGIDINDLKTKISAIYNNALSDHAEILNARGGLANLDARLDGLDAKDTDLQNQVSSNVSATSSINGRLDTIVANAGNGTVPSEVIEARVDSKGKIYPTLASHMEILDTISIDSSLANLNLEQNFLIRAVDGVKESNASAKMNASDYIYVKNAKFVHLETIFYGGSDGYAFYDENKKFISGSNVYSKIVNVPANAYYFRFTIYSSDTSIARANVIFDNIEQSKKIEQSFAITENQNVINFNLTNKFYVRANDGIVYPTSDTRFWVSDEINVLGLSKLNLNSKFSNNLDGYAFYDIDKKLISGSTVFSNEIQVPENASYFKFTVFNFDTALVNLRGVFKTYDLIRKFVGIENKFASLDSQSSNFDYYYGIGKTLMIGDSLTSGAYYDTKFNGSPIQQNVPYYLSKMTQNEVTNGGVGGWYPSIWYDQKLPEFEATLGDYDTVTIWFGTNKGLTDTLDADVNAYSDYNQFATTETGYYCKLIERIREVNPDVQIHLMTVFATTASVSETNATINAIAQKYGLLVIDMSDLTKGSRPELHINIDNHHFGKAGNLYIANRIKEKINDYYANDLIKLEFGLTPRTN